jgi:hypothetical protein
MARPETARSIHSSYIHPRANALGKVKVPRNKPEGPEGRGRGIALLFRDLDIRRGWMVSTTPRPIYSRERTGTHCTGSWVGPRAGLNVCEKSRPNRDSIPEPSSP